MGWSTRLIAEANEMKDQKVYRPDDTFLESWIRKYRYFVEAAREKHGRDADLAASCEYEFASTFMRFGGFQATYFLKDENNPYLHAEGFWTALASLLPAWRDCFPLTRPQVDALLASFDATYDEAWKNSIRDLAMSGLIRFTPEVLAQVRARVAGLGPGGSSD
jgi:hypothetical protein